MTDVVIICTCLTKLLIQGIKFGKGNKQAVQCPECGTIYNTNIKLEPTTLGTKKKRGGKK